MDTALLERLHMVDYLYRFRSIESLLGERRELENQEIYFAPPEALNDPMEGLRDIFWQGDTIVWKNLIRHYLLCLDRACTLLTLCGEEQPFGWDQVLILNWDNISLTPHHKALQDEIRAAFFGEEAVHSYIEELASRATPIRRNELAVHLRYLHLFAITTIYGCYERHNLVPKEMLKPELHEDFREALAVAKAAIGHIKRLEVEHPESGDAIDAFFTAHCHMNDQLAFIRGYNGEIDTTKVNKNFVFLTFCDDYVKQIEKLIYPDWYTACFMADCQNSSVWGSYGVSHTGACLIFKVSEIYGRPFIRLNRMNGYSGSGPLHGEVEHEFLRIGYGEKPVPIDFFKSLGRLSVSVLQKYWYSDDDGNQSACGDGIFKSEEEWRNAYWRDFYSGISSKLNDWSYEQEYRLILAASFLDFSDPKLRKAKYDFNDLTGIIFGIRTPEKDKLAVCKIIEEKCRKDGRTDFKFYQASYSREKGTIERSEMELLRFQSESRSDETPA
jgi:hypothetical protein